MMPEPIALSTKHSAVDAWTDANIRTTDRTYRGAIAVYATSDQTKRFQRRMQIGIRDDLYKAFNHKGALLVTRIDEDTFQIEPHPDTGRKTPSFHFEAGM